MLKAQFFSTWSISHKLISLFMLLSLIVICLSGISFISYDRYAYKNVLLQELNVLSQVIANRSTAALSFGDRSRAYENLSSLSARRSLTAACIFDSRGQVFAEYSHSNPSPTVNSVCLNDASLYRNEETSDKLIVLNDIELNGNKIGTLMIQASLSELNQHLLQYLAVAAMITTFISIIAFWISNQFQKVFSRPILELENIANHISKHQDYTIRAKQTRKDELGHLVIAFNDMLNTIQEKNAQLEQLAFYDPLTKLPNRRLFKEKLNSILYTSLQNESLMCLFFIDLDKFKAVNDTFGHDAGDILLIEVTKRFLNSVSKHDIVARLAGDEFTVILKDLKSKEDANNVAQVILSELVRPIQIGTQEVSISGSIGIAFGGEYDAQTSEALIKQADGAMYHAKDAGRNNFQLFSEDMLAKDEARLLLETELLQALETNDYELRYSPQHNVETNLVTGSSASIAWNNNTKGLVHFSSFYNIAESIGLSVKLGRWALEEICKTIKRLENTCPEQASIAFPVTAKQILAPDFLTHLEQTILYTGISAYHLVIEVSENIAHDNFAHISDILKYLSNKGVSLIISQFGSGYSSIEQLKKLPISKIKIDATLTDSISSNPHDRSITSAVIAMANKLDLQVIATNIHNMDQLIFLRQNNCHIAEGDLYTSELTYKGLERYISAQMQATVY